MRSSVLLVCLAAGAASADTHHVREGGWDAEGEIGVQPQTKSFYFGFDFARGKEHFELAVEMQFTFGQIEIAVAPHVPDLAKWNDAIRADAALYLKSPESLRDHALARQAELVQQVEKDLANGSLTVCGDSVESRTPIRFEGRPDGSEMAIEDCVRHAMSDADRKRFVAAFHAEMARREKLIRSSYRAWHAALAKLAASTPPQ
jgi:hypothetical protein